MSKNLQLRLPDRKILTKELFDSYLDALYDGIEDDALPATTVIDRALNASQLNTKDKKTEALRVELVAYHLFDAYEAYRTGHIFESSYLSSNEWKIPGMSDSDSLQREFYRLANILNDALGENLGTQAIKDIMSLVDNAIKKAKGESIGGR